MAFVSKEDINNIRAKADIVDIINDYIPLTQKGRNYVCRCPFHDDNSPSLTVSREKQIYKCFACGATGNVFTFVSEYENVSFIEAVRVVANKCGLDVSLNDYKDNTTTRFDEEYKIMELSEKFFQNNLKTKYGDEAIKYLHNREINDDIIKEYGIGLSLDESDSLLTLLKSKSYKEDKLLELGLINESSQRTFDFFTRRITFPLWDKDGHIVGFSARIYRGEKDTSKYMNTKETIIFKKGETLYNYHKAKDAAKKEKEIIVVEGFMDAIRCAANDIKNVVALQGTAMTPEQINLLKKLRCRITLCLDNDNAGLMATISNGEELVKNGLEVNVIRLSGEKDPDEYIIKNGKNAFIDNIKNSLTFLEFKINYYKQDKNLNNAEDLALYINEIIDTLNQINDPILKEITINKLSKEYNISVDILKEKLKEEQKITISVPTKEPVKEVTKKDAARIASEKILYMMLNGVEYINEYQNKLGFFKDKKNRTLANEILYYAEKNGTINIADFLTHINDMEELRKYVYEIIEDKENEEISIPSMDEYIKALNRAVTQTEIKELKEQMRKELDVNKKVQLAMQIAELKKDVF